MKKLKLSVFLVLLLLQLKAQQSVQQTLKITSNGVNSTEILMYKQDNVNYHDIFSNSSGFGIYDSSTNQTNFVIDHLGNMGIGTKTPQSKLHISQNANTSGAPANAQFFISSATYPEKRLSIAYNTSSDYSELQSQAYTGSYSSLVLNPNGGNVGIGTTTPKEKLSVNGKIRAHEVKVETANWPDYVFEEGYKVETLEKLESYIKTNKHLPEVPSAKEVASNGVELGEMNKILLKKVEELTLHLIEKDRKITNLENSNTINHTAIKELLSRVTALEKNIK